MLNKIQANSGGKQVGFGSEWKNLEALVENPKITTEAATKIAAYIKEEAPNDGLNVVLHLSKNDYTDRICALVTKIGEELDLETIKNAPVISSKDDPSSVDTFRVLAEKGYKALLESAKNKKLEKEKRKIFNLA